MSRGRDWEDTLIAHREESNKAIAEYTDETGELRAPDIPPEPVYVAPRTPFALKALTIPASTVVEGTDSNLFVATVANYDSESTLEMTSSAEGRFVLVDNEIRTGAVATDYESATSHSVAITETNPDATNSPRTTNLTISVTNVYEKPSLSALTLSNNSFAVDAPVGTVIGTISGRQSGSSLDIFPVESRVALSGSNLTVVQTVGAATSFTVTVRETLSDSPNSPRSTVLTINVTTEPEE